MIKRTANSVGRQKIISSTTPAAMRNYFQSVLSSTQRPVGAGREPSTRDARADKTSGPERTARRLNSHDWYERFYLQGLNALHTLAANPSRLSGERTPTV
ncbi:MAG TPA: hypothetical protein VFB66_12650 [Tepidisphaeraceae bacterium]|nr:hypothetical protein [Tepidisphaeraceae bacterium]